jgi:hypothetical protein
MKRLSITAPLIITCLLTSPFLVNADPELKIALKSGANAATLAEANRSNRYGFTGGLEGYLQNSLTTRFLLGGQVELLYTQRGAKTVLEGEYLGQIRSHYIDISAAIRPEVRLGPASLYLLLGGSLDVLANANKENASGANQDITDGLRRIDVALLGGAGVALHLPYYTDGPFRLDAVFLEARHDIGLIGVDPMVDDSKNRSSSLMLGLSLAVGGSTPPSVASEPR